jgi:hypothetical protein
MGMKWRSCFSILTLFLSLSAFAAEITETFSTRDQFESGTAVWNQALGKVHPSLQVVNYQGATTVTAKSYSVSDGSHGAFEPSTYSQFSVGGNITGNKIRFDLSRFPTLQVTSFYLASGWVLEPVGSAPLIIHSLTSVRIEGEIHCHGDPGTDAVGATPGTGGGSRCGGKAGGNGGAVNSSGTNGEDISLSITGGLGGNPAGGATATGGGGGGSLNTTSLAGPGPNSGGVNAGDAGDSIKDPEFNTVAGGAGGGGGSGNNTDAGAGGGGGGGVVIIHAVGDVDIGTSPASVTGFIYANGGKGGDSNAAGGPGGGGGGGSIKIFSGATVHIYNSDATGASQALQGAAGTNTVPESGANGGPGRSWVASVGYTGGGTYTPTEEAPVIANNNTVEFASTGQEIILKSQDLASTRATVDSLTFAPASNDFSVMYQGSDDNFQGDATAWTADASQVANKRYLKLKLIIITTTPAAATMIDSAVLTYSRGERKDFEMKSSGCGAIQDPRPPSGPELFLFLIFLALPLFAHRLAARSAKRRA